MIHDVRTKQENLEELIMRHEGYRDVAYLCTTGHLSIGVGHKILPEEKFKKGVKYSKEQLMQVFRTDLANAKFFANLLVKEWQLPEDAYNVIVSMIFQMGSAGVGKFKKFLVCLKAHDWIGCKDHGLDSKWAKQQTPERAEELMTMLSEVECGCH